MDPDYDKFDFKFDLPYKSPVEPIKLTGSSKFNFSCYKGISCFNACCKQADITLTPYDILRLKKRLNMTSGEFLKTYTLPFEIDGQGLPGVKLRTEDHAPICKLLDGDNGCGVYSDRPAACRYYPMGLMNMKAFKAEKEEQHYFLVKETHCTGHNEQREITVDQYREEQGVKDYDDFNFDWYKLVLKKKSTGPTIGRPSPLSFDLFFMASYDVDRFRQFITSKNFRNIYLLDDAYYNTLQADDFELAKFGFRLCDQVLFGNETIPLVKNAYEKRYEERKEIIEAKYKLAEELAKQETPIEKYIDK